MRAKYFLWLFVFYAASVAVELKPECNGTEVLDDSECPLFYKDGPNTESLIAGDCDFATLCNWVVSTSAWKWNINNNRNLKDHTMTKNGGGFLALNYPNGGRNTVAQIVSPKFPSTGDKSRCLTFWYMFDGSASYARQLSVKIITQAANGKKTTQIAWLLTNKQQPQERTQIWHFGRTPIVSKGDHYIMFEATKRYYKRSKYTAIDDVIFTDGPCSVEPAAAKRGTNAIRPQPPKKPAEEKPEVKTPYDCTFEKSNTCNWTVTSNHFLQWKVQKGSSSNPLSGPRLDHTLGTISGYYIIMKPNTNRLPYMTDITSPMVPPGMKCLSFYYYMWGKDVTSLTLYSRRGNNPEPIMLWKRLGDQGPMWRKGQLNIEDKGNLTFTLQASSSSIGKDCEIAVDDIMFRSEECKSQGSLCDFEDKSLCTYTTNVQSPSFENTGGAELSGKANPPSDHTLNSGFGHYLTLESNSSQTSIHATLTSRKMPNSEFVCLRFWYYIGESKRDSLALGHTYDPQDILFHTDLEPEDTRRKNDWQVAQITYAPNTQNDSFVFYGSIINPHSDDAVALDDLQMTEGFCGYEGDCNFDNYDLCTWNNGVGSVEWQLMYDQVDHTTTDDKKQGGYISVRLNNENYPTLDANLYSQSFPNGTASDMQNRCLHFWYKFNGTNIGTLSVIQEFETGEEAIIWSLTGTKIIRIWAYGKTPFENGRSSYRLVFRALMGTGNLGEIAVDDVMISDANCAIEPRTADPETSYTDAPEVSTPVPASKLLDCNFYNKQFCHWFQLINDDVKWSTGNLSNAESHSVFTPPSRETQDSYLFVEYNYSFPQSQRAIISSPPLEPASTTTHYCFSFWSYVFGPNVGNLTLKIVHHFDHGLDNPNDVLWKKVGTQMDAWEKNYVTINLTVRSSIEFQADIGDDGVLALDDFEVDLEQCPVSRTCGFENLSCNWASDVTAPIQWLLSRGDAFSHYFPAVDHTTSSDNGWYMKINNTNNTGVTSRYGIFESETYPAEIGTQCLKFWYYLSDAGSGILRVTTEKNGNHSLWERERDFGERWRRAQVPITTYSPFKIYIKASFSNANPNEHISIDDISLVPNACDHAGTCNFETGYCGYTNDVKGDSFDWLLGYGRTEHPERIVGPQYDSSGRRGLYLYIDFTSQYSERTASIRSDPIVPTSSNQFCLQFSYFFLGRRNALFTVLVEESNITHITTQLIWSQHIDEVMSDQGFWKSIAVPITSNYEFEVMFLADNIYYEQGEEGFIGIDNVIVSNSICAEPIQPPDNTTEPEDSGFGCNFEKNNFGIWEQPPDAANWIIGQRQGSNMPKYDHTLNNDRGRFMYINTVGRSTGSAQLNSRSLKKSQHCVTFWYMMSGNGLGSLSIKQEIDGKYKELWNRKGNQGLVWRYGQVRPQDFPNTVIQIEAHFEKGDHGFIAVDDIDILTGECPPQALCTFDEEGMCGISQMPDSGFFWIQTTIPLDTALFPYDHTTNSQYGNYLYLNTTGVEDDQFSIIRMDVRNVKDEACLRFWLFAGSENNNIKISTIGDGYWPNTQRTLYGIKPQKWTSVALSLDGLYPGKRWQVEFEASNEENLDFYLALDDVEFLVNQSCGVIGNCDFEQDTCLWQNLQDNTADWQRYSGSDDSTSLPNVDHTTGVHSGYYLYFQHKKNHNDVASFVSSVLLTTDEYKCFSFWYLATDTTQNVATFDIFKDKLAFSSESMASIVINGTQGKWKLLRADIPEDTLFDANNFMIRIVATVSGAKVMYIAVDDFQFDTDACDELLPESISCNDEKKTKVQQSQICDFVRNCPNNFDEQNCGSCNFEENMCNYTTPSSTVTQWTWHTAADAAAHTSGLAPSVDHTKGTSGGHYMIPITPPITANHWRPQSAPMKLHTPMMQHSSPTCHLIFWYYAEMVDSSFLSTLEVNLISQDGTKRTNIFRSKQKSTVLGSWTKVEVYLGQVTEPFAIEFVQHEEDNMYDATLALDDVSFNGCGYPAISKNCTDSQFTCTNSVCVDQWQVCDFSQDCGDGSDEAACSGYTMCDFEENIGLCDWTSSYQIGIGSKNRDWQQESRAIRDHTYGSYEGHYVYTTGNWKSNLTSGVLQPGNSCTMRYYYFLQGYGRGNLTVKTRSSISGSEKIYKIYDHIEENGYFIRDQITFREDKSFEVFFQAEGVRRNVMIALDDISFGLNCTFIDGSLNDTEVVNENCPGQFQCNATKCIDMSQVCDFHDDCDNHSDETDCGSCDFDKSACNWEDKSIGMFRWTRQNAGNIQKHPTLPPEDHTFLSFNGSYMVVQKTTMSHAAFPSAVLESPIFQNSGSSCQISFWYHYDVTNGIFQVKLKSLSSSDTKIIATLGGSENPEWHPFTFTIGILEGPYLVLFEADVNEQQADSSEIFLDLAVDDVLFSNCSLRDELIQTTRKDITCDFDNSEFCNTWYQDVMTDDLNWKFGSGSTPTKGTGPEKDHTTVAGTGNYIYLESVSVNTAGLSAFLLSSLLPTSSSLCFTFFYHMFGEHVQSLGISLALLNGTVIPIWLKQHSQSNSWLPGEVNVDSDQQFQIMIYGITGDGPKGDIAIDDVSLTDGKCRTSPGFCDFEMNSDPLCKWSNTDWKLTTGNNKHVDHTTGTKSGHFWSAKLAKNQFAVTSMNSYMKAPSSGSCISFWYSLVSPTFSKRAQFYMNVTLQNRNDHGNLQALTEGKNVWEYYQTSVMEYRDFKIELSAFVKSPDYKKYFVAIDDVNVANNSCNDTGHCDFETGMCGWQNVKGSKDNLEWLRTSGSTPSDYTGPSKDHTFGKYGKEFGFYLFVDASRGIDGNQAILESPIFLYTQPVSCFSFYYHMRGQDIGTLTVSLVTENTTIVYSISGDRGDTWHLANIELHDVFRPKSFRIQISAQVGDGNQGDIAIDDLKMNFDECSSDFVYEPSLTLETAASCLFENDTCNWIQSIKDDFNWNVGTLAERDDGSVYAPVAMRNAHESYIYVESYYSQVTSGSRAEISTPSINYTSEENYCFSFSYYMFGSKVGNLSLYMELPSRYILWRKVAAQVDAWQDVSININQPGNFKLIFEARMGMDGIIALDDFSVSTTSCDAIRTCTFEKDTCDWHSDNSQPATWVLSRSRKDGYPIPEFDHSSGDSKGNFMLLQIDNDTTEIDKWLGTEGHLLSPPYPKNFGTQCLQFWYYMSNSGLDLQDALLEVYATFGTLKAESEPLWQRSGERWLRWHRAQVTVGMYDPFQIVFRGNFSNTLIPAAIAIDDVQLIPSPCSSEGSCSFDTDFCGYTNDVSRDDFDWLLGFGRTEHPSITSGPATGASEFELYAYVDLTSTFTYPGGRAVLRSDETSVSVMSGTNSFCLQFYYVIYGKDTATLTVYRNSTTKNNLDSLRLISTENPTMSWTKVTIPFTADSDFEILFEALKGDNGRNAFIGIDSISINVGSMCEEPQVNHTTTPQNKDNFCSFEKGDNCDWGKGSWLESQEEASRGDNAPVYDHTTGTYLGRYWYIKTNRNGNTTSIARAQSPATRPGLSCVTFWYYMYGKHSGSLNVLQQIRDDDPKVLWTKSYQEKRMWRYAQVELLPIPMSTAMLESVIDEGDDDGYIAIDDINLLHDACPPEPLCTFDEGNPCGYVQAAYNQFEWNISPSEVESLPNDHTSNTKEGKFYYANTTGQQEDNIAAIFSPQFPPVDSACLKFWYYMGSDTSKLSVNLIEGRGAPQLASFTGMTKQKTWANSYATIESANNWQVEFRVTSSNDPQEVYVGLDDIEIMFGDSCAEAVACDFEQDMCSWENELDNNLDWNRKSGYEIRTHTYLQDLQGPLVDHSTGTGNGYYIYIINEDGNHTDQKAKLLSNVMQENFKCFSYWYLATADDVATLSLEVYSNHYNVPVLPPKPAARNASWQVHRWDLKPPVTANDLNFQVELTATLGSANGTLALDDLRFHYKSCADLDDGEVNCLNGKGTVKRSEWCDFKINCEDNSDELYCGNCDFEDDACYYNDVSRGNIWYEWTAAGTAFNKTKGTAPSTDHSSETADGHYVVPLPLKTFTFRSRGEKAIIQSPLMQSSSATCRMTFWAFMPFSVNTKSRLQVSLVLPNINSTIPIFEVKKRTGEWESHEVFIGRMTQPFMVEFLADCHQTRDSFAIDDVNFDGCLLPTGEGHCDGEQQIVCPSGACYDKNQKCDFSDDCGDENDEKSCDKFTRCDFEEGECGWKNYENKDGFQRVKSAISLGKIPTRDHTKATSEGHFMLVKTDNNKGARLMGPVLQTLDSCTMRFYYILDGTENATLTVKAQNYSDGPEHTYLKRTRSLGAYFMRGEVTFQEGKHFQVIIEATVANCSNDIVALDDISFSDDCLLSNDPLEKNPDQQVCKQDTNFQCKTIDKTCLPLDTVCDFNLDCKDGSDESVCAQCDFTSGQCGWNDVSPGVFKWQLRFLPQPRIQMSSPSTRQQSGWVMDVQRSRSSHTIFPSAFLESHVFRKTATTCQITFSYRMRSDVGSLQVYLRNDERNIEIPMLPPLEPPPNGGFESIMENLGIILSGYQLVFVANVTGSATDDVGISITNVSFANCSQEHELHYPVDWDLDCPFNNGLDGCKWYQERADDQIDWKIGYGSTPTKGTGPEKDHTTGDGQYLYVTASKVEDQEKAASLRSFLIPENGGRCLTFYYHMFGEHVNALEVHVVTKDEYDTIVWQKKNSQGNVWRPAEVDIFSDKPHQIFFTGITGKGKRGDIAIDDIKILDEPCSVKDINFCDFEIDECGFKPQKNDLMWLLQHTFDHTTNTKNGQVLMSPEPTPTRNVSIFSKEYTSSVHGSCAQLWVRLNGINNVDISASIKSNGTLLKSNIISSLSASEWEFVALSIEPSTMFQVALTVYVAPGSENVLQFSNLFVDDFLVSRGPCASEGTCNFELGLCAWENINTWFQWLRTSGSSSSDYYGPITDHTNSTNNLGFYLTLDSTEDDSTATMRSSDLDVGPEACFSLYYSMIGKDFGSLSVELSFDKENYAVLRSVKDDQDGIWKPLIIELKNLTAPYWFQIKGQVNGDLKDGNMAIDDVLLTSGACNMSDYQVNVINTPETTIKSTTTITPTTPLNPTMPSTPSSSRQPTPEIVTGSTSKETTPLNPTKPNIPSSSRQPTPEIVTGSTSKETTPLNPTKPNTPSSSRQSTPEIVTGSTNKETQPDTTKYSEHTTDSSSESTPPNLSMTEAKSDYGWVAAVVVIFVLGVAVGGLLYYRKRKQRVEDTTPISIDNPLFDDNADGFQPFGYQEADTTILAFHEPNKDDDGGAVNPLYNEKNDKGSSSVDPSSSET